MSNNDKIYFIDLHQPDRVYHGLRSDMEDYKRQGKCNCIVLDKPGKVSGGKMKTKFLNLPGVTDQWLPVHFCDPGEFKPVKSQGKTMDNWIDELQVPTIDELFPTQPKPKTLITRGIGRGCIRR